MTTFSGLPNISRGESHQKKRSAFSLDLSRPPDERHLQLFQPKSTSIAPPAIEEGIVVPAGVNLVFNRLDIRFVIL
jgi:hypothetical protein